MVGGVGHTDIEYVLNPDGTRGYAWNPVTGCAHTLAECACADQCWAQAMAKRFGARWGESPDFAPEVHVERFGQPFPRKPATIAVCFRGDLWGDWADPALQRRVVRLACIGAEHTFLVLTKVPQNYGHIADWPANAWVGASVTDPASLDRAIQAFAGIAHPHKWLSLEPMLAPLPGLSARTLTAVSIRWVVIGALAPGRMTQREWVEAVVRACDEVGIPVWLKCNLRPVVTDRQYLRQEVPW